MLSSWNVGALDLVHEMDGLCSVNTSILYTTLYYGLVKRSMIRVTAQLITVSSCHEVMAASDLVWYRT